jgi:hypothetical protein
MVEYRKIADEAGLATYALIFRKATRRRPSSRVSRVRPV